VLKTWNLLHTEDYINCLGALTGGRHAAGHWCQSDLSGWQVAADNGYAAMYPDQSLYPVDSVPKVVERINNTFRRR
jgi:isocitrate lyase